LAPRNEIAIHAPFAFAFYEDEPENGDWRPRGGGGAELQTRLLAEALARSGLRVAHVIYEHDRPTVAPVPNLELVKRKLRVGRRSLWDRLSEVPLVWRSLSDADARLYLFRGGGPHLAVGAAFCFLHRRGLVVSASNDLDFIFDRPDRSRWGQALYRAALRRARVVVVQTVQQLELARRALAAGGRVELIPSFAEPASASTGAVKPEAFLWAARLVPYKQPLRYLELARAVPEARFRMIAPGTIETTDALSQQLTEAADELPNLELLPPQGRETVLEMIGRSTAVVVTSLHEGMPNVFLEAWARGVPVISLHFDPDGRIADEGLGLFADGSWEEFVAAARKLWEEPELRRQMGDRGREYVTRVHSPESVGERWTMALRDALG
jgi:glycosyltransferase involved in cell wall biosynthesis